VGPDNLLGAVSPLQAAKKTRANKQKSHSREWL
jgi:hypothetical protein